MDRKQRGLREIPALSVSHQQAEAQLFQSASLAIASLLLWGLKGMYLVITGGNKYYKNTELYRH